MPLPTSATADFAALMKAYRVAKIDHPWLKAVTLAQWALESGWGKSSLAAKFKNYGGAKWRVYMSPWATPVSYAAHDGTTQYCKFESHEKWIAGYWGRFDKEPMYDGWKKHTDSAVAFLNFIGPIWLGLGKEQGDAYVRDVARIHDTWKFADEFIKESNPRDGLITLEELIDRLSRSQLDGV